jgi:hypothetical protein
MSRISLRNFASRFAASEESTGRPRRSEAAPSASPGRGEMEEERDDEEPADEEREDEELLLRLERR